MASVKKSSKAVVAAHASISGRVQGIFFRASARSEAQKRHLVGWVKNTPDGKVEILAQGAKDDVDDLLEWCRSGPVLAKVESVEVVWKRPDPGLAAFEVRELIPGLVMAVKRRLTTIE